MWGYLRPKAHPIENQLTLSIATGSDLPPAVAGRLAIVCRSERRAERSSEEHLQYSIQDHAYGEVLQPPDLCR